MVIHRIVNRNRQRSRSWGIGHWIRNRQRSRSWGMGNWISLSGLYALAWSRKMWWMYSSGPLSDLRWVRKSWHQENSKYLEERQ